MKTASHIHNLASRMRRLERRLIAHGVNRGRAKALVIRHLGHKLNK